MSLLTLFDSGDSSRFEFQFNERLTTLPPSLVRLGATYTRNSLKNVLQDGALVSLSANTFGTSYDPVTSLYAYMPEPAATNLALYSEQFDNAYWVKSNITITGDSVASPNLAITADTFTRTGAGGYIGKSITVTAAAKYTYSCFVKKGTERYASIGIYDGAVTHRNYFDLDNGGVLSGTEATPEGGISESIGNGWYRISIVKTAAATFITDIRPSTSASSSSGSNGATLYIWGAQVETGTRATSYILTTSGTAARAADVLSIPTANIAGFSATEYSMFADYRVEVTTASAAGIFCGTSGGANQYAILYWQPANSRLESKNVTVQALINLAAPTTSRAKLAGKFKLNDFMTSLNGVAGGTDTSGTLPSGVTKLCIGDLEGTLLANCYIYSVTLYTRALTQAQLNAITL